jgi:hypothetical protein
MKRRGERGESGRLGFERRKRREVLREEERRSLQEGVREATMRSWVVIGRRKVRVMG